MNFLWPFMLFSLLLIPVIVYIYIRQIAKRRTAASQHAGLSLLQGAAGKRPGYRRHIPPLLFLAGLSMLLVAAARPQAMVSLPRVEGTVIIGVDVSGSMGADDLKPTRMDAAKSAIQEFVQRMPETVQVGVVAFSDNGFAIQIPTNNKDEVLAAIDRLKPQRGTSLGQGIQAALNILAMPKDTTPSLYSNRTPEPTLAPTPVPPGVFSPGVIVLLTDGENNASPNPLELAQTASERGVRIYTVGIGSASGAILKVEGFSVRTRLEEGLLKQISQMTGGEYYRAGNEQELQKIYSTIQPQLVVRTQFTEVTSLFAGVSIAVMILGGIISLLWFSRLP